MRQGDKECDSFIPHLKVVCLCINLRRGRDGMVSFSCQVGIT